MRSWANAAVFAVAVGACSSDESSSGTSGPDASSSDSSVIDDVAGETEVSVTADVAASACSATDLATCLYMPEKTWEFATNVIKDKIVYEDLTKVQRTVNIALYVPKGAPTPMPVVLLSHGGADGKVDPLKSMEHWAPIFARAGYLTVGIAHEGRSDASYDALCDALGTQPELQCGIKIHWDRPQDVKYVLDFLEQKASEPDFAGQYDLEKVAHVGHSAGAGAALMSVGVTRNFVCAQPLSAVSELQDCQVADLVSLADARIDVAVALSPQGPGNEGFMEESYGAVDAPILMATGLYDGDGDEPANRLLLWPSLPPSQKYKLYLNSEGAIHTLFEGNTDGCVKHATEAECETMRSWVFSTGLAFVRAHLDGDPAAIAWLASDDVVTAGQGIATFERK